MIIRTVLWCIVYHSCAQWYALTWAELSNWFRFLRVAKSTAGHYCRARMHLERYG